MPKSNDKEELFIVTMCGCHRGTGETKFARVVTGRHAVVKNVEKIGGVTRTKDRIGKFLEGATSDLTVADDTSLSNFLSNSDTGGHWHIVTVAPCEGIE